MAWSIENILSYHRLPRLRNGTLVLAFGGWMDGGDVSTGTVQQFIDSTAAEHIATIDPEPFYIYNFPGTMEISALFRPHISIADGIIESLHLPENQFYVHEPAQLIFFIGKEPNLLWRTFGDCLFRLAAEVGVTRILFVGSFGGTVPHTREPRLFVTCSHPKLLGEMEAYGVRRSGYSGPGSFTSYLMTRADAEGLAMTSLVAEIPGYLNGTNPLSIEAVTRRLGKILNLKVDLDRLRVASTAWELHVSRAIDEDQELAQQVRQLEQEYDNELLRQDHEH
jgi:proteasome assembly chaperone (PAC2) family protein